VKFNYYPCPDATTPKKDCDTFEACVSASANCVHDGSCSPKTQLAVAAFSACFEGFQGHTERRCTPEIFSNANATRCAQAVPGLDYEAINKCFTDTTAAKAALVKASSYCAAVQKTTGPERLKYWPWTVINGKPWNQDPDSFPLLPRLCGNYSGSPKPKECTKDDVIVV